MGLTPVNAPAPFKISDFNLSDKILAEGKPSSWWLARSYMTAPHQPEVVICGSSQIGGLQAADARVLNRPIDFVSNHHCDVLERDLVGRLGINPYVFISALPGAMISDHFAIARSLFGAHGKPALLVLTVSPRDFIDNTLAWRRCHRALQVFLLALRFDRLQQSGLQRQPGRGCRTLSPPSCPCAK